MAGVDALALQEIYVTDVNAEVRLFSNQPPIANHAEGERRNGDLDVVCYLLQEHLGDPWAYKIVPNRQRGDKSQLCAMMWNTARLQLSEVVAIPVEHRVDGDVIWDRAPHAFNFTSLIDAWRRDENGEWQRVEEARRLTIVPLHMKSNWGGGTVNIRKREKEADALVKGLEEVADQLDETLILIGDTNVLRFDEPAIETLVNNGFVDLNNTDSPTYWSRQYGDSPFDRAFVAAGRAEFRYSRQYTLRSADLVLHDKFLSDHHMIKLSVKIYVDDADPRTIMNVGG